MNMTLNQRLATVAALAAIGGGTLLGTTAMAATNTSHPSTLAQKIADRFNVNVNDVQSVIDQNRANHAGRREAKLKSRLDTLVKNGTITQTQEDKIITELQSLRQTLKADNRHDHMDNRQDFRNQINQWLKDNGISYTFEQLMSDAKTTAPTN